MIVFNLKCSGGHGFEGWFRSSDDFETRRAAADIACPECGSTSVEKGLSAPRINGGAAAPAPTPCGLPACAGGTCAFS